MRKTILSLKHRALSLLVTAVMLLGAQSAFAALTYTVIAGDRNNADNEGLPKLFDGDYGTKWGNGYSEGTPQYFIIKVSEAVAPEWYCLVTANDTQQYTDRNWKTWKIYGANFESDEAATRDAEGWTLVDSKENIGPDQLPAANFTEAFFDLSEKSTEKYLYFRLEIEACIGTNPYMQMAEFFFGEDEKFNSISKARYDAANAYEMPEYFQKSLERTYKTAVRNLRYAEDIFQVAQYDKECKDLQAQIKASADAYQNYITVVNSVVSAAEDGKLNAEGVAKVEAYKSETFPKILSDGKMSADEISAEAKTVGGWVEAYSSTDLTEGYIDVTYSALSGVEGFGDAEHYSKLVDGDDMTKWCSNKGGYFIIIKASAAIAPTYYRLFTSNDTGNNPGRNWKTWQIYGGNFDSDDAATRDAEGWELIEDKQNSNVLPAANNTEVFINLSNPSKTPYQYFKVEIKEPNDIMQMSEISFFNQANFYKERQDKVAEFEGVDLTQPILQNVKDDFTAAVDELRSVATLTELSAVAARCSNLANQIKAANTLYANTGNVVLAGSTAWGEGENWTRLVDGDLTTKWGGGRSAEGAYLIFRTKTAIAPYFYTLVTGNDTAGDPARNWADWTIYAANFASDAEATREAEGWTVIAQEEGIGQDRLPAANFAHAHFDFATTPVAEEYTYFRIEVPKSYDNGGNVQMTELIFKSAEDFPAVKEDIANEMKAKLTAMGATDVNAFIESLSYVKSAFDKLDAAETVNQAYEAKAAFEKVISSLKAPEMANGYYQIGTPDQLQWLAGAVKMGFQNAKAQLTADLDMGGTLADGVPAEGSKLFTPIGTTEVPFIGEFDGQGHVISNLVINTGEDFSGLFGRIAGAAVIKNFIVDSNSYIGGARYVGVIGASNGGNGIVIDRIGMEGTVVASGINAGGIYGCNMGNPAATISNCYVTGTVIGADQAGQMNGWLGGGKIENSWAIGAIEGVYNKTPGAGDGFYRGGAVVGGVNYSNAEFRNATVSEFNAEDAKSGAMTFALNGNKADGAWFQNLGEDELPTLNATHKKVYAQPSDGFRCDGLPLGEITYTNDEVTPNIPAHEYEGYYCKNCGQINPNYVETEDGAYKLSNADELAWFSAYVNGGKTDASAKLTADIDMAGVEFTPIGNAANLYKGTFDGQFYTIKNFNISGGDYTGLFGIVTGGAVIKNFIVDSNSTISGNAFVGIIGGSNGGGDILMENIGMEGAVNATAQNAAGIYGVNMGAAAHPVMKNCYVSGPVIGAREAGQITGYAGNGEAINCLGIGDIQGYYFEDMNDAMLRGNPASTNCYSTVPDKNATVVTPEQIASGELTYLLNGGDENGVWKQTIGEDTHPTLDQTHAAVTKAGDSYINILNIATAEALVAYAQAYNGGVKNNAKLTADIDMSGVAIEPIGTEANLFTGTFDGQGHVISNLTIEKEGVEYVGLFGRVGGGATIKNFTLKNAKLSGQAFIGIVGGSNGSGTVTLDKLGFEGEAVGTAQNVSGIIGVNMSSAATFNISNCYVTGKVAGGRESAAITGWTGGSQSSIVNCWSTAEVSGNDGGKPFYRNDDTKWSNCFNQSGEQVTAIPEGALASGELAYKLNNNNAEGAWRQTIGEDEYPVLVASSKAVYAKPTKGFRCDGLPLGDIVYTNDVIVPEIPAHEYDGFICKNCGQYNPDFKAPVNGVYELATAEDLAWFGMKVNNSADKALNAKLTADVDLSAYPGTEYMIGTNNNGYAGTFDGQFHTVKVAYVNNAEGGTEVNHSSALFRFLNGGTVKNIITTGTIETNQKYASGLVGKTQGNGGTMENVETHVVINSAVNGDGTHAGFLGVADAPATITNAVSAIVINGESTTSCGGLSGWASQPVTFNNCLMVGEINVQNDGSATFSRNPVNASHNNTYYLEGVKELQDNGNGTKVTADQLASGEIAVKLGAVFHQNIGEDAYPTVDPTHGYVKQITEIGYATLYLPENVKIPEGIIAHSGQIVGDLLWIQPLSSTIIWQNFAVVLKGAPGYYSFIPVEQEGSYGVYNVLKGTDVDLEADGSQYVLAQKNGVVGFYKAEGTIAAGKAYLLGGANVKGFGLSFDGETGIAEIAENAENDAIYDLSGRRVEKAQKGIYIINGKKVLK